MFICANEVQTYSDDEDHAGEDQVARRWDKSQRRTFKDVHQSDSEGEGLIAVSVFSVPRPGFRSS